MSISLTVFGGYLTRDAEKKESNWSFTICCNKQSNGKEEKEYMNVYAPLTAIKSSENLKKGTGVIVSGRVSITRYVSDKEAHNSRRLFATSVMIGTSGNINKVIHTGNLAADPELRKINSGTSVCNIALAYDVYKKENGTWTKANTEYTQCSLWGKTAEWAANNLHKGDSILVDGKHQTREYQDKNGSKQKAFSIFVNSVTFGYARKSSAEQPTQQPTQTQQSVPQSSSGYDSFNLSRDDICKLEW